jgi:hypothetical protein
VGKTTTAVNLAASLAAAEKRVLLVDLDPQGNASSGLGHTRGNADQGSIYDLLIGDSGLADVTRKTELPHLDLIPANADLAGAEIELVTIENRERRLRAPLREAADRYDYVIVDTPPSLGLLTLNALTAADAVLVPMQCEYYALEGPLGPAEHHPPGVESLNPGPRHRGHRPVHGRSAPEPDPAGDQRGAARTSKARSTRRRCRATCACRRRRRSASRSCSTTSRPKGARSYFDLAREFLTRQPDGRTTAALGAR